MTKTKDPVNALEQIERARAAELEKMNGRSIKMGGARLAAIAASVLIGMGMVGAITYMQLSKGDGAEAGVAKTPPKGLETVLRPERPLSRTVGGDPAGSYVAPPAPPPVVEEKKPEPKGDAGSVAKQSQVDTYDADTKLRKLKAEDFGELESPPAASGGQGAGAGGGTLFASENNEEGLAGKLTPVRLEMFKAGKLKNMDLVLTQSSSIPCALTVAIDSTVPGFISCMVTEDVYGASGKVKLIDKFSKISGRQEGGMQQGQARIFAAWDRLETPEGVIVDLGSPATDELGRSGVGGKVDNHWLERYGNAILLSVIQDGISAAFQNAGGSSGSNNVNISTGATSNTMQDMASEALKNSINIPPTLYKNQGELVYVMVARDLDFSGVYSLEYVE